MCVCMCMCKLLNAQSYMHVYDVCALMCVCRRLTDDIIEAFDDNALEDLTWLSLL